MASIQKSDGLPRRVSGSMQQIFRFGLSGRLAYLYPASTSQYNKKYEYYTSSIKTIHIKS